MADLTINGYRNNYGDYGLYSNDSGKTKSVSGNQYDLVTGKVKPPEDDKPKQKAAEQKVAAKKPATGPKTLTPEQEKQIQQLKAADQKVRTHEQAHLSAGGGLVRGGASFQTTTGPDGKQYAIGGEVSIDTTVDQKNPDASIAKMQQVMRAALAPSDPSPQDRSVAQAAAARISDLQSDKAQQAKSSKEETKPQNVDKTKAQSQFASKALQSYSQANSNYTPGDIINKSDSSMN
jgi:hypothetical protein